MRIKINIFKKKKKYKITIDNNFNQVFFKNEAVAYFIKDKNIWSENISHDGLYYTRLECINGKWRISEYMLM